MINVSKFFLPFSPNECVHTHTLAVCLFCPPSPPPRCIVYSKLFAAADDKSPFLNIDSTFLLFAPLAAAATTTTPPSFLCPNELIKPKLTLPPPPPPLSFVVYSGGCNMSCATPSLLPSTELRCIMRVIILMDSIQFEVCAKMIEKKGEMKVI